MTLDLSLFSTISSASASFVAIIGGLIASKLITINGERESIEARILELDELIEMKSKEEASIGQQLDEDDALDYITDHIDDIADKTSLADVYETDKPQRLEFEILEEYWNIAIGLYEKFQKANIDGCEVNDDDIPIELATEFAEDDFMYSLCEKFAKMESGAAWILTKSLSVTAAHTDWYNGKRKEQNAILRELDVLKLQKEQAVRQKNALVKPPHMKLGLIIFAGIIVFCILLPLLFMKLIPHYPNIQSCAETTCLIFATIGLLSTIFYMGRLLQWKHNKTDKK